MISDLLEAIGNGGVRLDWRIHVHLNGADPGRGYIALYKPYLAHLFLSY